MMVGRRKSIEECRRRGITSAVGFGRGSDRHPRKCVTDDIIVVVTQVEQKRVSLQLAKTVCVEERQTFCDKGALALFPSCGNYWPYKEPASNATTRVP